MIWIGVALGLVLTGSLAYGVFSLVRWLDAGTPPDAPVEKAEEEEKANRP